MMEVREVLWLVGSGGRLSPVCMNLFQENLGNTELGSMVIQISTLALNFVCIVCLS